MRVYIAAPYAARNQCRAFAVVLRSEGIEVTSTWLEETTEISASTVGPASAIADEQVALHAHADLWDIDQADALVLLTESVAETGTHPSTTGGRHIETGYAIGRGLEVLVVGEPENVFHRAAAIVSRVDSLDQVSDKLRELVRTCRACGCTDRRACLGFSEGCHWVEADLCSACKTEAKAS